MWNHPTSGQEAEVRVEREGGILWKLPAWDEQSRSDAFFPCFLSRVHSLRNWDLTSYQCCFLFRHFRFIRGMFSCHLALCKHYFKRWGIIIHLAITPPLDWMPLWGSLVHLDFDKRKHLFFLIIEPGHVPGYRSMDDSVEWNVQPHFAG